MLPACKAALRLDFVTPVVHKLPVSLKCAFTAATLLNLRDRHTDIAPAIARIAV